MMNETFSRHHRMMNEAFGGAGTLNQPGRGRHRSLDMGHGGHFHSSSSVMTFSNTGNGQPTFYHATSSETAGPGGVSEPCSSAGGEGGGSFWCHLLSTM